MHSYCPVQYLEWPYRRNLIQRELARYAADIVCLQEVETRVFEEELTPFFSEMGLKVVCEIE